MKFQSWWNTHYIIIHGLLALWALAISAGLWLL